MFFLADETVLPWVTGGVNVHARNVPSGFVGFRGAPSRHVPAQVRPQPCLPRRPQQRQPVAELLPGGRSVASPPEAGRAPLGRRVTHRTAPRALPWPLALRASEDV